MASINLSGSRTRWKASSHRRILSDSYFQKLPLAVSREMHSGEAEWEERLARQEFGRDGTAVWTRWCKRRREELGHVLFYLLRQGLMYPG